MGSTTRNSITYVDRDLSLGGNSTGYGILVVTGTLTMSGNFSWYGLVLVVGDGDMQFNGGGNGQIVGMMIDANIWNNHTSQNLAPQPGFADIRMERRRRQRHPVRSLLEHRPDDGCTFYADKLEAAQDPELPHSSLLADGISHGINGLNGLNPLIPFNPWLIMRSV